jgi:hypothetical protein
MNFRDTQCNDRYCNIYIYLFIYLQKYISFCRSTHSEFRHKMGGGVDVQGRASAALHSGKTAGIQIIFLKSYRVINVILA